MPGGPLGSGTNRAFIHTRGGRSQLLELTQATDIEWGRARNAFSTAKVTVTANQKAFGELGKVHTWAHELVIFRDRERVWEGPIRYIDSGKGDTIIYAVDVLGWLAKRVIHTPRRITSSPATLEMAIVLEQAFGAAGSTTDPNVINNAYYWDHPDEVKVSRDVSDESGYYSQDFTGLAGTGANFTVIGRAVHMFPDQVIWGRLDTLIPERDTTADVRVIENGDALATFAAHRDADGRSRVVYADNPDVETTLGVSTYYGRHDYIASVEGSSTNAALDDMSEKVIAQLYPAPVTIQMPSDSQLLPRAPFFMRELVPGSLVPVESSVTSQRVSTTLLLDSMKVTQNSGGEAVSVTLVNPSTLVGADT